MSKLTNCINKPGLASESKCSKTGTVLTARRFQNYILKNNINLRRATHDLCSNKNCYLLDFFLDGITTINNTSEITQQLFLSIDVDFYLSAGYSTFVITQESKPKLVHQIYARVNILTKVLSGSHTNAIIFKADLTGKPHVVIDIPTPNKNCSSKHCIGVKSCEIALTFLIIFSLTTQMYVYFLIIFFHSL